MTDDFDETQDDLCDLPLEVIVHRQAVILTGPDGVNLAMTVEAVERSIKLLHDAVATIRGTTGQDNHPQN